MAGREDRTGNVSQPVYKHVLVQGCTLACSALSTATVWLRRDSGAS